MAVNNFLYYYFGSLFSICDCVNLLLALVSFHLFSFYKEDVKKMNSEWNTNTLISFIQFSSEFYPYLSVFLPRLEHMINEQA